MIQNIIVTVSIASFFCIAMGLNLLGLTALALQTLSVGFLILAAGQAWHVRSYHNSLKVVRAEIKACKKN